MGIIKTKGIVINEANCKDNDKILTMLTPDLGKITVSVKGGKRANNLNMPSCQLLALSEIVAYKNTSDIYILNSAQVIELFYNIRMNVEKLYYVTYLCKLTNDVANENENTYQLMQLLLNAIYLINSSKKSDMLIVNIFQIRLLRILGFMPRLNKCVICQLDDRKIDSFSIIRNGVICQECKNQDKGAIEFTESTFNAIKYILISDAKKIFSFNVSDSVLNEIKLFIKIYLKEKLEREYDIDKYMKNIM